MLFPVGHDGQFFLDWQRMYLFVVLLYAGADFRMDQVILGVLGWHLWLTRRISKVKCCLHVSGCSEDGFVLITPLFPRVFMRPWY